MSNGGSDSRRQRIKNAGKRGREYAKRGRRGFVVFITSDKILQAILTGSVTAVVFSTNEAVAAYFQRWLRGFVPFYVPVKMYAAFGAAIVVMLAYYADRHTEEWREYVREKTGEETAEDTASEEDVAGESKE